MPLHDWTDERGWDSVYPFWLAYLVEWIQPRLPEGYKAFLGGVPALTVASGNGKPDVSVRKWGTQPPAEGVAIDTAALVPDLEVSVAVRLDPQPAVHVDLHGQLIAAIELVLPRNKDRADAKETYFSRYLGYLRLGVHLLLVDVLPRPQALLVLGRHHTRPGPGPAAAAPAVRRSVPRRRGRPGRTRRGQPRGPVAAPAACRPTATSPPAAFERPRGCRDRPGGDVPTGGEAGLSGLRRGPLRSRPRAAPAAFHLCRL